MKNRPAFTLVETVLAVSLTTIVLTGVCGLILTTMQASAGNRSSLQATYLAQEGLELARFVRDSNWLQNYEWDGGGAGTWGQDFSLSSAQPQKTLYFSRVEQAPFVQLSTSPSDGEFKLGALTFKRALTVEGVQSSAGIGMEEDQIQVRSIVTWQERGRERSVELSTFLSNWK